MPWDLSDRREFIRKLAITLVLLLGSTIWISYTITSITYKVHKINRWLPTKCVIESIRRDADSDSDPPMLVWNTSYTYTYGGKKYTSNRYSLMRQHRILTREEEDRISKGIMKYGYTYQAQGPFSQGDETICFVNPRNPSEAILTREYKFRSVLLRLFPSVVLLILGVTFLFEFIQTFYY